jgi:hypothetical protein
MHQLTKNIETLLKQLAQLLPPMNVNTCEKHLLIGQEILEWETITEIDGEPIKPDKTYTWTYPVITNASHYRRLKRKYIANGIPGVKHYLEWVNTLAKGKKIEQQMQMVMTIIKTIDENNS